MARQGTRAGRRSRQRLGSRPPLSAGHWRQRAALGAAGARGDPRDSGIGRL